MVQITKALLDPFLSRCVGRWTEYALQQDDGRYHRMGQPLTYDVIMQHLQGRLTIGVYVIDEHGLCRFAVFDSDTITGLMDLALLQQTLRGVGVSSHLECSRRGAHLWVFFSQPLPPAAARAWLLPFCPAGVEFYPKQDALTAQCPYGSLIRLPLGVHRMSGERYPFVELAAGQPVPLASSLVDLLAVFDLFECCQPPDISRLGHAPQSTASTQHSIPFHPSSFDAAGSSSLMIHAWCRSCDPVAVIGRYVRLDQRGMGSCPFGWHHSDGVDQHPSLWVYRPVSPNICCWYCHTWQAGGSLFDFLRYYYDLTPRELWSRLVAGGQF